MIQVAVGIITQEINGHDTVLLCQRKHDVRYALKWEFPGGKLEKGEEATDCLRRELREELGIDATVGEPFHRQHCVYSDRGEFDVVYYRVSGYSGEIDNRVFESIEWVRPSDLNRYDILEGNAEAIRILQSPDGD